VPAASSKTFRRKYSFKNGSSAKLILQTSVSRYTVRDASVWNPSRKEGSKK